MCEKVSLVAYITNVLCIFNYVVTSCTSNPCLNHGDCEYVLDDPYYKCNCSDGSSGEHCEGNTFV